MIQLTKAARAWGNDCFNDILKAEVEQLDTTQLPLQTGLSHSSYVSDDDFRVMVIGAEEIADHIRVHAGIFYAGIIAGCNCADDPTPVDSQPEYCEVQLDINRETSETIITLLHD